MNYIIVTEGRAGSTLLCQYLRQMGIGDPKTYLSSDFDKDANTVELMAEHLKAQRVDGILGVKVSWGILMKLDKDYNLNMNTHQFLNAVCPNAKYLYCTRNDRVHQALSRIKHLKMDQSHVSTPESYQKYREKETEKLLNMSVPVNEIYDRIQLNIRGHKAFDIYFKGYKVPYLEVVFEDLVAKRDSALENVCKFLDMPLRLDLLEDKLRATHTEINDKWHNKILGGYHKLIA